MKRAKWSEYADQYEEFLNSHKEQGKRYEKIIKKYNEMISKVEKLLDDKIPSALLSDLVKSLDEYYKGLEDVTKGYTESLEAQIDVLKKLNNFTEKGGLAGFSTLNQIEATKNIAMAAVLIAFSSIGFSISSAILSVVK